VLAKKNSRLTPTILCIHRAGPSTVQINRVLRPSVIGTGVIVDQRGYVITNRHVVGDEREVNIRVLDSEEKVHKGEVIRADEKQDLALLRISTPGKYPAVSIADSDAGEAGEAVVAIGNPFGYTGTATLGIVSALNREITMPSKAVLTRLFQTDASINPGNSGGPLLNINGELIGIILAVRLESENIAFAIPSNCVREDLNKALPR
jgi:serine protease Do